MPLQDSSSPDSSEEGAAPYRPGEESEKERSGPGFGLPEGGFARGAQNRKALDELFSLAYEELRRLASSVRRGDPSSTMSATALVNETWLKLAKSPAVRAESPLHFKRIAARAMRQLLVEAARRRNAQKRGCGETLYISFEDSLGGDPSTPDELIALDGALNELAQVAPRQAGIVESRFFGGLEMNEIAVLFDISEATVMRDWRAAKAWLGQRLK